MQLPLVLGGKFCGQESCKSVDPCGNKTRVHSWLSFIMDPFYSLFLLSGASWVCSLEGWSPVKSLINCKLTRRHYLGGCNAGIMGTLCCFIFMMLHSISETPNEVLDRTWWESRLSVCRAYNNLLLICSWEGDTAKHHFSWRKVWVLRIFHVWRSLF